MVNQETLDRLLEGTESWNRWRFANPDADVDLSEANLLEANLSGADLSGADLSGADLSGANLLEANLSGANLRKAELSGADLSGANLRKAELSGAKLSGANFSGASLIKVDLSGANLCYANFSGASLIKVDLSGADLRGANFSGASLIRVDLSGARWVSTALVPVEYLESVLARPELLTWEESAGADINSVDGNVVRQLSGSSRENVSETVYQIPVELLIVDADITEVQRVAILDATNRLLDACSFELALQSDVRLGSFYQKLLYRFFGPGGQKAGEKALKDGQEALRQRFIDAPQAQSANQIAEAAKNLAAALQSVDNGVLRMGTLIVVKVTRNSETFMIAEMMTPELARELQECPALLKDPEAVFGYFEQRESVDTTNRPSVAGANALERDSKDN